VTFLSGLKSLQKEAFRSFYQTFVIKEGQTNIAIVNKLLRKIGYKSSSIKRAGSRDDRRQIWRVEAEPYQAEVFAALEQKWTGELSTESIEIEQPSAPVSSICDKENTLMQISDTGSERPIIYTIVRKAKKQSEREL